eukprot:10736499-Lingulodinium_polyedra.AAC.1
MRVRFDPRYIVKEAGDRADSRSLKASWDEKSSRSCGEFHIDPVKRKEAYLQTAEFSTALARQRALYLANQVDAMLSR